MDSTTIADLDLTAEYLSAHPERVMTFGDYPSVEPEKTLPESSPVSHLAKRAEDALLFMRKGDKDRVHSRYNFLARFTGATLERELEIRYYREKLKILMKNEHKELDEIKEFIEQLRAQNRAVLQHMAYLEKVISFGQELLPSITSETLRERFKSKISMLEELHVSLKQSVMQGELVETQAVEVMDLWGKIVKRTFPLWIQNQQLEKFNEYLKTGNASGDVLNQIESQ